MWLILFFAMNEAPGLSVCRDFYVNEQLKTAQCEGLAYCTYTKIKYDKRSFPWRAYVWCDGDIIKGYAPK